MQIPTMSMSGLQKVTAKTLLARKDLIVYRPDNNGGFNYTADDSIKRYTLTFNTEVVKEDVQK